MILNYELLLLIDRFFSPLFFFLETEIEIEIELVNTD